LRQVRNTSTGAGRRNFALLGFQASPHRASDKGAEHDRAARNIDLRRGLTNYDAMFKGKMHNLKR
jgi:hypothetical protein